MVATDIGIYPCAYTLQTYKQHARGVLACLALPCLAFCSSHSAFRLPAAAALAYSQIHCLRYRSLAIFVSAMGIPSSTTFTLQLGREEASSMTPKMPNAFVLPSFPFLSAPTRDALPNTSSKSPIYVINDLETRGPAQTTRILCAGIPDAPVHPPYVSVSSYLLDIPSGAHHTRNLSTSACPCHSPFGHARSLTQSHPQLALDKSPVVVPMSPNHSASQQLPPGLISSSNPPAANPTRSECLGYRMGIILPG